MKGKVQYIFYNYQKYSLFFRNGMNSAHFGLFGGGGYLKAFSQAPRIVLECVRACVCCCVENAVKFSFDLVVLQTNIAL